MKLVLSLAVVAALLLVFSNARAVEDPPQTHVQIVEPEQQTPYLESASIAATSQTQSRIVRPANNGLFSSFSYVQFDNHNPDGSRATVPLEVEDAGLYGISATFVRGPNHGIVQLSIDGRPLGEPFDGYAATLGPAPPILLGTRALAEGKHMLAMTVTGKNADSTDYLAGLDLLVLDTAAAAQPTPTAVATTEAGGTVPAVLALSLGAAPSFGAFQPGVSREYTASTTATIVSTAGDAALSVSDPGHLANGSFSLPSPLQVSFSKSAWTEPTSNEAVAITFKQAIAAGDKLRTGSYTKALTFTLSTTNP
jgi:hypothetical protein